MYVGNDLLNQLINQQEEETKHKNEIIIGGEKKNNANVAVSFFSAPCGF